MKRLVKLVMTALVGLVVTLGTANAQPKRVGEEEGSSLHLIQISGLRQGDTLALVVINTSNSYSPKKRVYALGGWSHLLYSIEELDSSNKGKQVDHQNLPLSADSGVVKLLLADSIKIGKTTFKSNYQVQVEFLSRGYVPDAEFYTFSAGGPTSPPKTTITLHGRPPRFATQPNKTGLLLGVGYMQGNSMRYNGVYTQKDRFMSLNAQVQKQFYLPKAKAYVDGYAGLTVLYKPGNLTLYHEQTNSLDSTVQSEYITPAVILGAGITATAERDYETFKKTTGGGITTSRFPTWSFGGSVSIGPWVRGFRPERQWLKGGQFLIIRHFPTGLKLWLSCGINLYPHSRWGIGGKFPVSGQTLTIGFGFPLSK